MFRSLPRRPGQTTLILVAANNGPNTARQVGAAFARQLAQDLLYDGAYFFLTQYLLPIPDLAADHSSLFLR
jgi:hypothetical protein